MTHVVFVAPYFLNATERFIHAATQVPGARVGLVSVDPVERLRPEVRQGLAGHFRVDGIGTNELLRGVRAFHAEWGSVDRLMGMLEQIQVPLGEIRDLLGIPGMSAEVARNFRDKARMKSVLRQHGIPCARHRLATSIDEAVEFQREIGGPIIVKPPDGAGAKGTFRVESSQDLIQCLNHLRPSAQSPALLEEFITGREFSFDSVCHNGEVVWHSISHYYPGPLEVIREPWIQWCVVIPRETHCDQYEGIVQHGPAALRALGMQTGLSHMEWFLRGDGSTVISEVGARPPGAQFTTLLSWAHDHDFYRAWAELMIHGTFARPARKFAAGAAYLRAMRHSPQHDAKIAGVQGVADVARELGDLVVEARLPQIGARPSDSYEGDGYIIVRHPETGVVHAALDRIINSIRVVTEPAG